LHGKRQVNTAQVNPPSDNDQATSKTATKIFKGGIRASSNIHWVTFYQVLAIEPPAIYIHALEVES